MRLRILLIATSLALLGFAPAPLPRKERAGGGATDVSGTWQFVVCSVGGRDDEESKKGYVLELTREQFVFVWQNNQRTIYPMRLDPGASPPSFTWSQNGKVVYVGTYQLRNDELTMVFTSGDRLETRPT